MNLWILEDFLKEQEVDENIICLEFSQGVIHLDNDKIVGVEVKEFSLNLSDITVTWESGRTKKVNNEGLLVELLTVVNKYSNGYIYNGITAVRWMSAYADCKSIYDSICYEFHDNRLEKSAEWYLDNGIDLATKICTRREVHKQKDTALHHCVFGLVFSAQSVKYAFDQDVYAEGEEDHSLYPVL